MHQITKCTVIAVCLVGMLPLKAYTFENEQTLDLQIKSYQVLDAQKAADFCRDKIGMTDVSDADSNLAGDQRRLRYGSSGVEIELVTAQSQEQRDNLSALLTSYDYDTSAFQDWMHSHVGIGIDDLSPLIKRLQSQNTPFLGPVRRADGLYQLYVRVEGLGYLEFDTITVPDQDYLPLVKDWHELWGESWREDPSKSIQKTDAYGGKAGDDFDSVVDGWLEGEKILAITLNWDSYLHAIELVYDSNFAVSYGKPVGGRTDTLLLEDGESINNAIVCTKSISDSPTSKTTVVSYVKFFTDKGQQKGFGESSDDCYYMLYNGEHEVLGIHGKASTRIDALGISFRPL